MFRDFDETVYQVFAFGGVIEAHGGIWLHMDAGQMRMNAYGFVGMHMDAY